MTKNKADQFTIPDDFPSHPGGQSTLECARAVSQKHREILFYSSHIGLDFDGRISRVARSKGVLFPHSEFRGPIYNEIHQSLLQIQKDHPRQRLIYQGWCLLLTFAFPLSIAGFNMTAHPITAMLMMFSHVSYAFNIFHMRNHRGQRVYDNDLLDRITRPFYDFLDHTYAIHPVKWRHNHNQSHHVVTNDPGEDYDILSPQRLGLRLHPSLPIQWYHQFQPVYVHFLLSVNALAFPIDNHFKYGGSVFYLIFYVVSFFLFPTYLHGWSALVKSLLSVCFGSLFVGYLFQVSHNHGDLDFSQTQIQNPAKHSIHGMDDWIQHQMKESISWGGYWSCLVLGGINYQVEHHVAPALPPTFYPFLSPVLKGIAKRQGGGSWRYIYLPNFVTAVWEYQKQLIRMSGRPEGKSRGKQL